MNSDETDEKPKKRGFIYRLASRPCFYLTLTFLIPVVIMYLIYVAMEIHPFGDGSVLVLDLNGQYVYFFEALRNWVYGDTSLLYSFSRALGGEFMGIYAYYLASPLSYIVCLFPKERMLEALLCLFLLKTGGCGLSFGYYLHKTSEKLNRPSVICFSVLYALSAYCIVQQHNTMWIDCVMYLPLVALGLESLIKYKKFKMFTLFLALTVFSNFYIGYMVCIFVAIYFFYYYFAHLDENNPLGEKHHFPRSLLRTVLYSALACGMAMVIIYTAYYSLSFGKNDFSNPNFAPASQFDFLDLISKFFPGSYDTVRPEGLPFVYCGVLTLFLVPVYFFSSKFSAREKILSGVLIAFFVLSFSLTTADLVWHGFQRPNWLNYRYSFMLCFVLLKLAHRAFDEVEKVSAGFFGTVAAVLTVLLFLIQKLDYENMTDFEGIWLSLLFVGLTLILVCLLRKPHLKENVSLIMIIFICLETFCSGLSSCVSLGDDVVYSKYSPYNDFLSEFRELVNEVEENDSSFYRMEKTKHRKTNDNMALGIRGLSSSTSTLNAETIKFLKQMGYASKSHWSKYLGGTPATDSLLGIKYIIAKEDLSMYYEALYPHEAYTTYLNPYALSLAFGVSSGVNEMDMSDCDNPFDRINELYSALLGEKTQIFIPIPIVDTSMTNLNESYVAAHYKYTPVDSSSDAVLYYYFDVPLSDTEYFFYLPSNYPREVKLSADGVSFGTFYGNETTRIVSVGTEYTAGDTMRIALTVNQKEIYVQTGANCLYYMDMDAFREAISKLAETQFDITDYTERDLCGTIKTTSENQTILTTVPYDEGWSVYLDGEKIDYYKTLDALIAFDISEAGEHTLELKYMPKCFIVGALCSVFCILIFILLCFMDVKKKKSALAQPLSSGGNESEDKDESETAKAPENISPPGVSLPEAGKPPIPNEENPAESMENTEKKED